MLEVILYAIPTIFVIGIAFCFYSVFISDIVSDYLDNRSKKLVAVNKAEKIAQVKILSDNAKDIETFVERNAEYLSDKFIKQLVSRLEYLNAVKTIEKDNLIKTRVEDPKKIEFEEIEINTNSSKVKKRK